MSRCRPEWRLHSRSSGCSFGRRWTVGGGRISFSRKTLATRENQEAIWLADGMREGVSSHYCEGETRSGTPRGNLRWCCQGKSVTGASWNPGPVNRRKAEGGNGDRLSQETVTGASWKRIRESPQGGTRPTWRSRPGNGSRFGNGPRWMVALSGAGASAPLTQASVGRGRWKAQVRASVRIERTAGGNTGGAAGTKVERPEGLAAGTKVERLEELA